MIACSDCPRCCQAERTPQSPGFCGVSAPPGTYRVAKIMAHHYEEPYLSGQKGSGAVFFSGCALSCVFCQNFPISQQGIGTDMTQEELADAILQLQSTGVHNLNLVTGSHYLASLPSLLMILRQRGFSLPIVWNSSAYESVELLYALSGLVDIYLPDLKFADVGLSSQLTQSNDYFAAAVLAIAEMVRQQPKPVFDEQGMMKCGTAVRHLVLPGQWRDSIRVIDALADLVPSETPLSIMSQYTPTLPMIQSIPLRHQTGFQTLPPELAKHMSRRVTSYEYKKVLEHAILRGFSQILTQDRSSAINDYTPDFTQD